MSDWRKYAACRDHDPELWFPASDQPTERVEAQINTAKAICARCPVLHTCRRWALDTGEPSGVWGGLSENDRRQLNRAGSQRRAAAKRRAAAPVPA
jgi:WhiB family redox-sensing transcriptional regulator